MIAQNLITSFRTAVSEEIADLERALWTQPPDSDTDRWKQTGYLQGLQAALDILQVEADKVRKNDDDL